MRRRREPAIQVKTRAQLDLMREAGLVVARTLGLLATAAKPGVTTADLDAIAEQQITSAGATPSFKGYNDYPATICTSVNDEIVHGIPSQGRRLQPGDVISIDCGAIVSGWHADAALTVGVGEISDERRAAMSKELGDVLWYVTQLASELGLELEDIARENLEKLFSRQRLGMLSGSGDDR